MKENSKFTIFACQLWQTCHTFLFKFKGLIMLLRRCGEEQEDKFYDKLERLLGDEAFSVEIFDDQEDQDTGV